MSLKNNRKFKNDKTKKMKGGKCGGVWPFQNSDCNLFHTETKIRIKQDDNCKKIKESDGTESWKVKMAISGWEEETDETADANAPIPTTIDNLENDKKSEILKSELDKISPVDETADDLDNTGMTETSEPSSTEIPPAPMGSEPSPFGTTPSPSPFANEPSATPFGSTPSPSPFGTTPSPSPFTNESSGTPFGAQPSPGFGAQPSPFGKPAQGPGFGGKKRYNSKSKKNAKKSGKRSLKNKKYVK